MGQLRGAVRALAPTGPPSKVLEGLDVFVEQLPAAAMATLAYAELDSEEGSITYACAGHPPPLLLPADGEPRLLWEGRSAPLGSAFGSRREQAVDRIEAGDTLVLFTDGLVERRTTGIAAGLESLVDVVRGASGEQPAKLVDRILEALLADEVQDDDACVLAVCRVASAPDFVHSFPAAPAEVARMRRALASWLESVDLDAERRRDVILAASEAAANAAEHAYGFDGAGVIEVEAWASDAELRLAVRDRGTWREPRPDSDRGRGRRIMEGLMPVLSIDPGDDGTTVRMRLPLGNEAPV
jgi:serine/threonine-protein kinase RsbW